MFSYPAFGIELGDGALKAVKMTRRGPRLVVTWADYRPYARAEDGAVRPVAGLPPRAEATLKSFLADAAPGPLDRVYAGFPSVATFNQLINVPDVGAARLQTITDYETHRSLRGPADDYVVRSRILRRHRAQDEIPCVLFAVRRKLRDAFVSGLSHAGLEIDNLVPSPAALALFARYDHPAKGDRIVVSLGLRGTEVVFLRDQGYAFRTLPLGVIGIHDIPATNLKRRGEAAGRLVERICSEIESATQFFFGKSRPFQPSALLLFGEGARLPEVVQEFRQRSPAPVGEVGTLNRIAIHPSIPAEIRERIPMMAQALGLAIAAARAERPEIELVPTNQARAAARRLPPMAAAALFLTATALFLTNRDQAEADRLRLVRTEPQAEEILARRAAFTETSSNLRRVGTGADALQRFSVSRSSRASLLTSVLKILGPDVTEYGESDLRLADLRVERSGEETMLTGKIRAPILDPKAATVLRQRLGAISTLRGIEVHEVVEERDEYTEQTAYQFTARIPSSMPTIGASQ